MIVAEYLMFDLNSIMLRFCLIENISTSPLISKNKADTLKTINQANTKHLV